MRRHEIIANQSIQAEIPTRTDNDNVSEAEDTDCVAVREKDVRPVGSPDVIKKVVSYLHCPPGNSDILTQFP